MKWIAILALAAACGGARPVDTTPSGPQPLDEQMLGLLPQGAQIIVEVDVARLRANPVVGGVIARLLDDKPLPSGIGGASAQLARARHVVLAAYAVGTTQAATVTLVATRDAPSSEGAVEDGRKIARGIYPLGPPERLAQ